MNAAVMMWARTEWRRRWGSLLLLAGLVAIGGGATITAAAAAQRTDTAFDRMLEATHQPNLQVSGLTDNGLLDLDPALLDQVMQLDGVRGATEVAFMSASPVDFPIFFSYAFIDERGEYLQPFYVDGPARDHVADMKADEVLINEAMRDQLHIGTGDALQLESATSDQFLAAIENDVKLGEPRGPSLSVRVIGVARTAEEVSDAPDALILFSRDFYETHRDAMWSCRCSVQLRVRPDAIDDVMAHLAVLYPGAQIGPTDDLGARLTDTVALQTNTWIVMAATAAASGALILLLACARFVRSITNFDRSHRALGMTQRESEVGRLLIVSPAIAIGALGAGGIAFGLSQFDPVGITLRAEPDPGLRWVWSIGGVGTLVVLACGLLIAVVCSVIVRHQQAVLRHGVRRGGPVAALGSRLAIGPGRIAALGALIASLGAVGALTLEHSLDRMLGTPSMYGADFEANVFEAVGNDELAVAQELVADPDIAAVATVWVSGGGDNQTALYVVGAGGDASLTPSALESIKGTIVDVTTVGRGPLLPDEVALGRVAMDELGVSIGDVVTVDGPSGPVDYKVVGRVISLGVDTTGNGFVVTLDGLAKITDPAIARTAVRYTNGADRDAVAARHPALIISPVVPPSEVGNIAELGNLPTRIAQLLLLLGSVALLGSIVTTLHQGRREVAIHRALGFTTPQVIGAHIWQSLASAAFGGIIGGFSGFVVGRAVHHQLANDVGAVADTVVPAVVWVVVAGVVGAALIAAAVTSALTLRSGAGRVLRAE